VTTELRVEIIFLLSLCSFYSVLVCGVFVRESQNLDVVKECSYQKSIVSEFHLLGSDFWFQDSFILFLIIFVDI